MFRLSSFNKVIDKELYNSVTEKSIGYTTRVEKYLPEIVSYNTNNLKSPKDKIFYLVQSELLFRGLIIKDKTHQDEETYLRELVPVKLPKFGFFYSKIVDFRGLDRNSTEQSILFLGIPCDLGAPRPGARFGPQILRDRSLNFNFRGKNLSLLDISSKRDIFESNLIYDIGNIFLSQSNLYEWLETIENVVAQLPKASVPIIIGGDHSLSLSTIKGVYAKNNNTPFTLVQLDYHLDLQIWGKFNNSKLILDKPTHANFMSWVHQDIPDIKIFQVGIFDYQSIDTSSDQSIQILEYFKNFSEIISNFSILSNRCDEVYQRLPINQNIYLTIDIDVINCKYMFQTGFPSATGISIEDFVKIIRYLCQHNNIIGVDIMEFGKSYKDYEHYEMATLINCIILDIIKIGIIKYGGIV